MAKEFLVSTADVAFRINGALAFTGKTALNTSISVSEQDKEIAGGKGSKLLFKYKFGRRLSCSLELVDWNLAYIAANVGTTIFSGLKDVFVIGECVQLTAGVGTLAKTPVGNVHVEKADGTIVDVKPVGSTITVGSADAKVTVTYQYNTDVKRITIDATTTPSLGELILSADKFSNATGKTGEVQIVVPSFQLNGTFDITLQSDSATTTKVDGDALAVEGATCADGAFVYAYITEIPLTTTSAAVAEISASPSVVNVEVAGTKTLTVIGIKGGMYANVALAASACTFVSGTPGTATVNAAGLVTGVASGTAYITVTYNGITDIVKVVVA